jgi:hypothetical protein
MSLLLSFLLLLAPIKVEQGRFNITKDGKKIGTEEFAVSMRGMNYVIDGKATIGDLTITSKMELNDKLVPISYEVSSPQGKIRVKVESPKASELQTIIGQEASSADFRFPENGVILDNNFFHHYLILLYRAKAGQTNFGVFVPQDTRVGSAVVRSTGPRTYDLEVGDVRLQATTDADGSLLKLTVPAAKVVVER